MTMICVCCLKHTNCINLNVLLRISCRDSFPCRAILCYLCLSFFKACNVAGTDAYPDCVRNPIAGENRIGVKPTPRRLCYESAVRHLTRDSNAPRRTIQCYSSHFTYFQLFKRRFHYDSAD